MVGLFVRGGPFSLTFGLGAVEPLVAGGGGSGGSSFVGAEGGSRRKLATKMKMGCFLLSTNV